MPALPSDLVPTPTPTPQVLTTATPSSRVGTWWRRDARHDLSASLVVFLVALPLSIGIAIASDAPVTAGLIAAAVGGIVAGVLGGSPLTVSGPAAGLTVVVAGLVEQFGFAATCAITVAAGLVQILLGASRVARSALAISPAVLHAMLAGIGITIVLGQVHVLLGGGNQGDAAANLRELPGQLAQVHGPAVLLGVLLIAVLLLWRFVPAPVQRLPAQLVAVVGVTVLSVVLALDVARVELPGSLLSAIALPELPGGSWSAIALGVLTVAIIASVESLLSAVATDKLAAKARPGSAQRADLDRELLGQGAANTVSGLLGGLPVTGVIVRSTANVAAGARTRAAAVLHGVWVLVFALALVGLIEQVPMAALAGLLVVMGISLVKPGDVRTARQHGELPVYLVTVVGVVFLNLLEGVLLGLAVALVLVVSRAVWVRVHLEQVDADHSRITLRGTLTFLSVPRLARHLAKVPARAEVTVELEVDYLDHTAYEHLSSWALLHEAAGGTVRIDQIGRGRMAGHDGRRSRQDGVARYVAPWQVWQSEDNAGRRVAERLVESRPDVSSMVPLLTGLHDYQARAGRELGEVMADLADGQRPEVLFLTCADSRLVPNVITGSGPGDLFTVRNVGNLVPVEDDDSLLAALEYGVDTLAVRSIVVCGHSGCGAMDGLLSGAAGAPSGLGRWLRAAEPSLQAWRSGHPAGQQAVDSTEVDTLARVNVAVQLDRLEQLPVVRDAMLDGRVQLAGLFYDLASGHVELLDRDTSTFTVPGR